MLSLVLFLILGLIAGYIARLVVPGPDPMGMLGTMLLGVVGSFIGGFIWNLSVGDGQLLARSGLIGSVIGAVIALLIYRAMGSRRRA